MTMFKMQFKQLYQDSLARWTQEHVKQSKLNATNLVQYCFFTCKNKMSVWARSIVIINRVKEYNLNTDTTERVSDQTTLEWI